MSYILDALRKAERARPRPATRVAVAAPPAAPARPLRAWPWVLLGAAAVTAGALVWLQVRAPIIPADRPADGPAVVLQGPPPAGRGGPEPAPNQTLEPPAMAVPPAESPASSAAQAPPGPEQRAAAPPRSERAPAATAPAAPQTGLSPQSPARPPAPVPPPVVAPPSARAVPAPPSGVAPSAQAVPAPERSRGPASGPVATRPAVPAERPAPPAVPGPASPARREPGSAPAAGSTGSQDVPAAVQALLKGMKLQFLVYSDVPSERLVFIDNQKLVEGQVIAHGLVVERIGPDRAVLNHQGTRFVLRPDAPASR